MIPPTVDLLIFVILVLNRGHVDGCRIREHKATRDLIVGESINGAIYTTMTSKDVPGICPSPEAQCRACSRRGCECP